MPARCIKSSIRIKLCSMTIKRISFSGPSANYCLGTLFGSQKLTAIRFEERLTALELRIVLETVRAYIELLNLWEANHPQ